MCYTKIEFSYNKKMTTITVKELQNFNNRFPIEFYKIYSNNNFFKNNKMYIVNMKEYKRKNIIITENIDNFYKETIIDVIEEYEDKSIIYLDRYGLLHINFFHILKGLDVLEFSWKKNKFCYKYNYKKVNFLNINEKNNFINYLENKKDPFTSTPISEFLEKNSYFYLINME